MRHEEMRGENFGDDRPRDGQRRQSGAATTAFGLQPGIRERGQHHVALPSRQRAALEVIQPEFVLELLILLLDCPALVFSEDDSLLVSGSEDGSVRVWSLFMY